MKIVERTNRNNYRFVCPECGVILEANGREFEFLRRGHLGCTCPSCKEEIDVKERKIEIVPVYKVPENN